MRKKKIKGSIIQFSSIYGSVGQDLNIYMSKEYERNMSYSVIKGGINNLTNQMASYYGRYGTRVNTVSPGAVEGHVKSSGKNKVKIFKKLFTKSTFKRLAKPSEVASLLLFVLKFIFLYNRYKFICRWRLDIYLIKMSNFTF